MLSKSDLGSQVLFQIFYSFLIIPRYLDQTCSSALRVPALIPPLLILSKSYSIPYFGRRIGKIFLGSSLPMQTNFCFYCKHFLRCLKGMRPFLSAKAELTFCSGSCLSKIHRPAPSIILFLSLCQLLSLCVLPFCLIASNYAYLPFNFYFSFRLLGIDF